MLSEALRLIRVFNDMKQTELAKRLGISKSYLSEIEGGRKQPKVDLIERYSVEFGIPSSSIWFFAENLKNPSKSVTAAHKARGLIARRLLTSCAWLRVKPRSPEAPEALQMGLKGSRDPS